MPRHYSQLPKQKGFTMLEVIIALFIFTLILLAVVFFYQNVLSITRIITLSLTVQNEARQALKQMTAEIRTALPSSVGAYPVAGADASSLTFYTNIDGDALRERVRYFVDGNIFKKGVLKPTGNPLTYNPANEVITEVVHDLTNGANPVFRYFDSSFDGSTPPLSEPINLSAIRLINITLIIDRDPSPPAPLTLTTQVTIRNLKDNL